MSAPPARLVRLRAGLAARRGVLFIGPDFTHGVPDLDLHALLDGLREEIGAPTGWDALDLDDRWTLAAQGLGQSKLIRVIADGLPSVEVLPDRLRRFHTRLVELPFPLIVDCTVGGLVEAALRARRLPVRTLAADDDLVARPSPLPGERTLLRLRGDLLLGQPALTPTHLAEMPRRHPALFARLEAAVRQGPVLLYGFGPRDGILRWLVEALAPLSGTAVLAGCMPHALWRAHWSDRGFEVVDAPDVPQLETRVERLCDRIDPRADLPALNGPLEGLLDEVGAVVRRALAPSPHLAWARLSPADLEAARGETLDEVRAGLALLTGLAERGLTIPAAPPALAAEVLLRAGDLPGARRGLWLAAQAMDRGGPDVAAAAAVGRALSRMGDPDRARFWLELALERGDPQATAARADELAWLSRGVLDRIDRLRAHDRPRALMELIATFLAHQASRLPLARVEPGDDEGLMWSVYYINLRLGRLMGLAAEMAEAAGEVYAGEAVALLTRAIELAPFKPDPYKFIRPLLTDRRVGTHDPRRWMSLVASAPPAVQRRLGGR